MSACPPAGVLERLRVRLYYLFRLRRWPSLDAPQRFSEWVQWRKVNDRDDSLAMLTDKLASKAYVTASLGGDLAVPTLWQGDVLPDTPPAAFPFVVKSAHGCKQWRVVETPADYEAARSVAPSWLTKPYGIWLDEWHYRAARRTLLIEPYLGGFGASLPQDYKVYVVGGHAVIVQLHEGRAGKHHRWTQFNRDWLPLSENPIDAPAPVNLRAMLDAAERLANGRDFLRVDFYEVDGRLWFGEFCLFPGSGLDPFRPDSIDVQLGELWSAARAQEKGRSVSAPAPSYA